MSLITKTERNLTVNTPASRSTLSIKSIIKDLQDLDKSLITKKEFGDMKMELKKLKEENARIKADLEATEADRMLYYNQYHQNGKELRALKAENKILKEENESLKQSSNVPEHNSSISSPISVTDTESDFPTNSSPQLPIRDDNANVESNVVAVEAKVSRSKRRLKNDETPDLPSKKATPSEPRSLDPSFKCMVCNERFGNIDNLQEHFQLLHPLRIFFCRWCPYAGISATELKRHENAHASNDLKYRGTEQAQFCSICDVCFGPGSGLTQHTNKYH